MNSRMRDTERMRALVSAVLAALFVLWADLGFPV